MSGGDVNSEHQHHRWNWWEVISLIELSLTRQSLFAGTNRLEKIIPFLDITQWVEKYVLYRLHAQAIKQMKWWSPIIKLMKRFTSTTETKWWNRYNDEQINSRFSIKNGKTPRTSSIHAWLYATQSLLHFLRIEAKKTNTTQTKQGSPHATSAMNTTRHIRCIDWDNPDDWGDPDDWNDPDDWGDPDDPVTGWSFSRVSSLTVSNCLPKRSWLNF